MPTLRTLYNVSPRSSLTSTGSGNEGGNFASSSGRSSGNHLQLLSWLSVFLLQSQSSIKACEAADKKQKTAAVKLLMLLVQTYTLRKRSLVTIRIQRDRKCMFTNVSKYLKYSN